MTDNDTQPREPTYKIGAVSRLTGIAPVTLRAWERRYNVVEPRRTEGANRLYTKDDIARLALIKRLVDEGNAVGTIAGLSLEQLQERLELCLSKGMTAGRPSGGDAVRVAVLGDALAGRLPAAGREMQDLNLVGVYRDRDALRAALTDGDIEVLLLEYPTLHDDTLDEVNTLLQATGAHRALVVYGFGTERSVRRLDTHLITPLRAPVGLPELRRLCLSGPAGDKPAPVPVTGDQGVPPRRFDTTTLIRIATASTAIRCECPHHLVDLVLNLTAFETYSAECVVSSPEDAGLHRQLQATTAQARALVEGALARLVEQEGLLPHGEDR